MWFLILLLSTGVLWAGVFCIEEVENDTKEPYLSYSLLKVVEEAILENGHRISCDRMSKKVKVRVKKFEEIPIAYTPEQRVSSYNLFLSVELEVNGQKHSFSSSVPYTLPYGGLGDIPRRKAIDDLLDKIYLEILKTLRR